MKYRGTFEANDFKDFGINYLNGVLHTYASLNQPDSNLAYDYGIIEIEKNQEELANAIKEQVDLFKNQSFTLSLLKTDQFVNSLEDWLFAPKFVSQYRINVQVNFVFTLIKELTDFHSIYLIDDFNPDGYDFGVGFEHYVLESNDKLYLLFFNYTD